MQKKGFTLIELLVVIAVIAVLVGALLLAINPASLIQKGRDAKRLQDMSTLVKAINLALADGEITLTETASSCGNDGCNSVEENTTLDGLGYVRFAIPNEKTGLSKYLATLPSDPLNVSPYVFVYGSDGKNFEVNCILEHIDNVALMSTDGGNASSVYEMGSALNIL